MKRLEPSKNEVRETFAGDWLISDGTGVQVKLMISRDGQISMDGRPEWTAMLERSNDQRIFPTSEGYYMSHTTYRGIIE